MLALVIVPALWLGGVFPETVVATLCIAAVAVVCVGHFRHKRGVRVPASATLVAFACLVTLIQWVPWGSSWRASVAPKLAAKVDAALVDTGVAGWQGLTVAPGDTGLEVGRLFALLLVIVAAANLSWRWTAIGVAAASCLVTLLGLFHHAFDIHAIYGLYHTVDIDPAQTASLLTSFVNPNHQSGLMLLGLFCAAGLAVDVRAQTHSARDTFTHARRRELHLMCLAAIGLLLVGLVLSRSRGAMLAGAVVTPLALWWAWMPESGAKGVRRGQKLTRGLTLIATTAALAWLIRMGAWDEVMSFSNAGSESFEKLHLAWSALALNEWSPVLGTGRGTFLDLFAMVDPSPGALVHTHLESVPLTMRVEWGLFGIAIGGGVLAWWLSAVIGARKRRSCQARRLVLCGLLALAIQNLSDFSVEFLGVAAPTAALVGALSPRTWRVKRRVWVTVLAVGLPGAMAIAATQSPWSWTQREAVIDAVVAGELPATEALRMLPMSGRLHLRLAREAAQSGAWEQALPRVRAATMLRPGSADGWLLRAAVEDAMDPEGEGEGGAEALQEALRLLEKPLESTHTTYLRVRYPDPSALAARMPEERAAWLRVVVPMIAEDPDYAAALIGARAAVDRHPRVLEQQVEVALVQHNSALALHAARLLREQTRHLASSHLRVVRALRSFEVPRERDIQAALETALEQIDELAGRGQIEEALVRSLMATAKPDDLERARVLVESLQERPADRATLKRRHTLAEELREMMATN